MASEAAKVPVPQSVNFKRKRGELWVAVKKTKAVEEKKKSSENVKVIYARAKQYAEEYDAQVRSLLPPDPSPLSGRLLVRSCLDLSVRGCVTLDL